MSVVPLDEARRRVAAAYKAGDREALRSAVTDYRASQAARRQSRANIVADHRSYAPESTKGVREGIGSGLVNAGRRVTRLALPDALTPEFASDAAIEEQTKLDKPLLGTTRGAVGRFVGDVAAAAPVGGVAGAGAKGVLTKLPGAAHALRMGEKLPKYARYLPWAAEGAAGAAATTDDMAGEGALMGAVAGRGAAALGTLGRVAGRGLERSPGAQVLLEQGADLTPGMLNPKGTWAKLEGAAASGPFGVGGTAIRHAQEAGLQPVVPNLVADLAGQARPGGGTPRAALRNAQTKTDDLYSVTRGAELAPAELTRLRQSRKAMADTARGTKAMVTETGQLKQARVKTRAERLAEEANLAVDRATKEPTPINVAKAKDMVARLRLAEDEVAKLDARAPAKAGRAAARKAIEDFVPAPLKDLSSALEASVSQHGLAKDAAARTHIMKLGRSVTDGKTVDDVQRALSAVRKRKRELRYGASPDFATARVYDDVEKWFLAQRDRGLADPAKIESIRKADRIYRDLAPIEGAAAQTGASPSGLVPGRTLEKAVQAGLTDRGWVRGEGGRTRVVAEALREVEDATQAGSLQRTGIGRALALIQSSVGGVGASPLVRRIARGDTIPQEIVDTLGDTSAGRALAKTLAALRPGVGAALTDSEE